MSESVVISKELRDRLHQSCIAMRMRDAADSLRSAPETVSLEGVDESNRVFREELCTFSDGDYSWGRLDLVIALIRRLVAPQRAEAVCSCVSEGLPTDPYCPHCRATGKVSVPVQPSATDIPCGKYAIPGLDGTVWKCGSKLVSAKGKIILCDDCFGKLELWGTQLPIQPSAVVSREDIGKTYEAAFDAADDDGYPSTRRNAALDAVFALQLPQPVAPVQSGGVERISELEIKNIIQGMLARFVDLDVGIAIKEYVLAHLTTTQSAPSVPSVLELEQVILPIWYGDDSGKPYAISNAIHALLTERMGTKP